jgi:type I restriction enzyme S subunit
MDVNGGQVDPRVDPWTDMVLVAPNHIESGTGRIVGRETAREQGADSGKYLADAGQILYSKIRPTLNKVAVAAEDCLTSADMYAMSSRRGDDHRYLMYFMLARPFHSFATLTSLRVKMPKINRDELGEAPFLRPPVEEQRKIVAYLDEQTAQIDTLIVEAERFIDLSRERRAALITAAVTGQIDVRDVA